MNVDFETAIKVYFANYANFKGRSTRAEYWWAMLFVFLLSLVIEFIGSDALSVIVALGLMIPNWAIATRRLHDIGKSGWWVVGFTVATLIICGVSFGSMIAAIFSGADPLSVVMNSAISIYVGRFLILAISIWALVWLVKPSGPCNQYGPNPYGE